MPLLIFLLAFCVGLVLGLGSCMVILATWKDWRRAQLLKDQR